MLQPKPGQACSNIPIFVAPDSADVWANQKLFQLDDSGKPLCVAGVPPDYFCADGQLWGFNIKESEKTDECYIVIVGTQEKKIGVMVDSLIGEEDVVIKPLRDQFTNSPGIAGASILGDGSVSLIIDVSQLLELGVRQELLAQAQASLDN